MPHGVDIARLLPLNTKKQPRLLLMRDLKSNSAKSMLQSNKNLLRNLKSVATQPSNSSRTASQLNMEVKQCDYIHRERDRGYREYTRNGF